MGWNRGEKNLLAGLILQTAADALAQNHKGIAFGLEHLLGSLRAAAEGADVFDEAVVAHSSFPGWGGFGLLFGGVGVSVSGGYGLWMIGGVCWSDAGGGRRLQRWKMVGVCVCVCW